MNEGTGRLIFGLNVCLADLVTTPDGEAADPRPSPARRVDEMTNDSPAATLRYVSTDIHQYQAGSCNIGPAEIRRRRITGHVGLFGAAALLAALVVTDAPAISRLLIAIPASVSASGYLQARLRFCANYGWRGVFNTGEIGDDGQVVDPAARAADRRMALRIGLGSAAIGLTVAIVAALLPI